MNRRLLAAVGVILCLLPLRAWAGVTFHAVGTEVTGSGTSATGTMPTASTNDILVADACTVSTTGYTCPSGWTAVTTNAPGGSDAMFNNICFIKYTGTTPALGFSWTGTSAFDLRIRSFTGANTTTPNDGNGVETDNNGSATTSLATGTKTPSQAGDEVIVNWCYYTAGGTSAGSITGSPTITNDWDDSAQTAGLVGNHLDNAGSGTTGVYTYTFSGGSTRVGTAVVLLLQPPAAAAGQKGWVSIVP